MSISHNPIVYYGNECSNSINIKEIILDLSNLDIFSINDINKAIILNDNIIYNTLIISNSLFENDLNLSAIINIQYCKTLIADNSNLTTLNLDTVPRNIKVLSLKDNNINEFANIKRTKKCKSLLKLDLSNNEITRQSNYRVRLLDMIPSLVYIDGNKISKLERRESKELNKGIINGLSKKEKEDKKSTTLTNNHNIIESLKQQLVNAETLEEIDRLEQELSKYS
ncbi:hypothetical protein ACO0SA_001006 [Hanseniaspora valbyensis]